MLFSLSLHYTWLYHLYHICSLLYWILRLYASLVLQMLHVLGRLASVIFLATCVTSDDPALYRCQPGTTPQGVTPAPNRETKFLFFLHIIPIFITSFLTGTLLCRRESIFLFLTFNSLCKPNNIIFKIFHFRWSFFLLQIYRKKRLIKGAPKKTIIDGIFFQVFWRANIF